MKIKTSQLNPKRSRKRKRKRNGKRKINVKKTRKKIKRPKGKSWRGKYSWPKESLIEIGQDDHDREIVRDIAGEYYIYFFRVH